jgi:hypothetical protein
MGLFGSKNEKTERTVRITELFTEEGLREIKEIVGPKVAGREYGSQYMEMASDIYKAACDAEKTYGKKELTKLIFATGAMTKLEPSLNPILKPAIEKYQAMKKNKEL